MTGWVLPLFPGQCSIQFESVPGDGGAAPRIGRVWCQTHNKDVDVSSVTADAPFCSEGPMKVRVCKNCKWWRPRTVHDAVTTSGNCGFNLMLTLDTATCSAYAFPAHADDYDSADYKGGGGGEDDGPVDITPRGPGGNQLTYKGAPIFWGGPVSGYTPALIPHDPDGDKKD